jgi:hypothetical protein
LKNILNIKKQKRKKIFLKNKINKHNLEKEKNYEKSEIKKIYTKEIYLLNIERNQPI